VGLGSRWSSLLIAKGKGHACGRATWLRRIRPSIQLRDSAGIAPASPGQPSQAIEGNPHRT
jgi:hypothetical protein